ncbi:uncharacterized protein A4U43_C09F1190 [Asparagus officinalis]|uniref:Uncharacterized protein n=1 Tax=Asparagus officinalis TaxID=4686 RepID=A0A5P1E7P9_ASPOF|nr:uncharacterized protein A4U43_C09F1190 [Asparagus officinalis]
MTVNRRPPNPAGLKHDPNSEQRISISRSNPILVGVKSDRRQPRLEIRDNSSTLIERGNRRLGDQVVVCVNDGLDVYGVVEDGDVDLVVADARLLVRVSNGDGEVEIGGERIGGEIEVGDFESRDGEFGGLGLASPGSDECAEDRHEDAAAFFVRVRVLVVLVVVGVGIWIVGIGARVWIVVIRVRVRVIVIHDDDDD